jgi:hypothetical protein
LFLCPSKTVAQQKGHPLGGARTEMRSQANDLRHAPLFAGTLDQFIRAVKQSDCTLTVSTIAPDLGCTGHEERQQDPILRGIELLNVPEQFLEKRAISARFEVPQTIEDRSLEAPFERFIFA